jgi:hypothetical protein
MAVDLEQVECFLTYTKEFGVLIQDNGVAKAILKFDLYNGGHKCSGASPGDRLQGAKSAHPAASNDVSFGSLETGKGTSHVRINMQYQKWGLDGEIINHLTSFCLSRV